MTQATAREFHVGQAVQRRAGYRFPGVVVAKYRTRIPPCDWRYVVECTAPGARGCQHIFNGDQLMLRLTRFETDIMLR